MQSINIKERLPALTLPVTTTDGRPEGSLKWISVHFDIKHNALFFKPDPIHHITLHFYLSKNKEGMDFLRT